MSCSCDVLVHELVMFYMLPIHISGIKWKGPLHCPVQNGLYVSSKFDMPNICRKLCNLIKVNIAMLSVMRAQFFYGDALQTWRKKYSSVK